MGESIQEEDLFEQALAEAEAGRSANVSLPQEVVVSIASPEPVVAVESSDDANSPVSGDDPQTNEEMLTRIGQMTRMFHDNLRSLGVDKMIEHVAHEIPDARDRLAYVAKMTEQAAERVLNATDVASPLQDELSAKAVSIEERWKAVMASPSLKSEYNKAAEETLEFLQKTTKNTKETKDLLMEIMMAQDFQDLTGQVIKKVTTLAQELEQQLVQVLVDFSPPAKKTEEGLMNGPQIDPTKVDVVASQAQVDDLLDSLGF